MARIIACAGGKGGVGKTTSVINLGAALTSFGKKVTIVDANLTTPNIGVYLGVPIVPVSLHDVLRGKKNISEAVYLHKSGTRVVPASIALSDLKKVDVTKLPEAIRGLNGTSDFILVDVVAGLGKEALNTIKSANEILVITNPEMPAVTDALKTIKLCEELNKPVIGVIVTKTNSKNADMNINDIETILEKPIIGVVPEDRAIKFSQAQKDAVINSHPQAVSSIQYKRLAAKLIGEVYEAEIPKEEGRLLDSFLRFLGFKE